LCPERTLENRTVPTPFQDVEFFEPEPATMWLADFRCRFAAGNAMPEGKMATDDLPGSIFSQFCIGK
jgi:hypothetical protein